MTVKTMAEALHWQLLAGGEAESLAREVTGCYVGDLLSWVMARAKAGDVWLTVMGNVNAIAVATLTDAAAIVLCENAVLDDDAKNRADQQGVPVFVCEKNLYQTAVQVHACL